MISVPDGVPAAMIESGKRRAVKTAKMARYFIVMKYNSRSGNTEIPVRCEMATLISLPFVEILTLSPRFLSHLDHEPYSKAGVISARGSMKWSAWVYGDIGNICIYSRAVRLRDIIECQAVVVGEGKVVGEII